MEPQCEQAYFNVSQVLKDLRLQNIVILHKQTTLLDSQARGLRHFLAEFWTLLKYLLGSVHTALKKINTLAQKETASSKTVEVS